MPPKRTSFLAQLERELPAQPEPVAAEPAPAPVTAKAQPAPARAPVAAPVRVKPQAAERIRKNTVYLTDAVQDRLREIAFTERCKIHDLFLEGIDQVIKKRGHPERASTKKAS